MTQLALIPPLCMSDDFTEGECFLYLPQLMGSATYDRYVWRSNTKLAYTILDNGAFEGVETTPLSLLEMAKNLNVDEVVVSDVLGDFSGTIKAVHHFERMTAALRARMTYSPSYMGVVQGDTMQKCFACVNELIDTPLITTIGLPKHLVRTVEKTARISLTAYIRRKYGDYPIHFLGGAPQWPEEILYAARRGVRSMDTSMPFVYAYHKDNIFEASGRHVVHERPPEYFRLPKARYPEVYVDTNVKTLQRWAHG